MINNLFTSYIPKFLTSVEALNDDILYVSSSKLSPQGDIYTFEKRAVQPNVLQTTESIGKLNPEVSIVYPFKAVTGIDLDGSTIVLSPTLQNPPTASQHYYAPLYFERYNQDIVGLVDKSFTELGQ